MGKGNRVSLYAYCPEPDKLLISGLFPYRKGQYLYEPPSSRGETSKVIPPDYLKRIFLLTTPNGKESERMNWNQIQNQSIVGLVGIAIAHIDNGDIDKARNTMMGIIVSLEGTVKE